MFQKSYEYRKIHKELTRIKLINSIATFECYNDSVFTYSCKEGGVYHEFNFITDEDLLNEMSISELLEMEGISYFNHSVFLYRQRRALELAASVDWKLIKNGH